MLKRVCERARMHANARVPVARVEHSLVRLPSNEVINLTLIT